MFNSKKSKVSKNYSLYLLSIVSLLLFVYISFIPSHSQNKNEKNNIINVEYKWGDSPFNQDGKPIWVLSETENWIKYKNNALSRKAKNNYLWYRLKLPNSLDTRQVLFITEIFSFFEIYTDNQKIYQFGELSATKNQEFLGFPWHIIPLIPEYADQYIYLRVYSDTMLIGLTKSITLDSSVNILKNMMVKNIPLISIGLFPLIIGILSWFLVNKNYQKEYRYFSLFVISTSIICISSSELKQFFLEDPRLWYFVGIICIYLAPIGSTGFLEFWVAEKYKKYFKYLIIFHILLAILGISFLFWNVNLSSKLLLPVLFTFTLLEVLRFILILLSSLKGNSQKQFLAFGMFVLLLSVFWDLVSFANITPYNTLRLFPWGLFVFTSSHIIIMNNFINIVHNKKEEYKQNLISTNQELKQANLKLEEHTQNLELKINEGAVLLNKTKSIKEDAQKIMRHDLKMPLSGIIGYTELLLNDPTLNEEAKNLADSILKSGFKMRHMINNSLDLFKMEEGTYELTPVQFNFIKMFQKINNELIEFKKSKSVKLIYLLEEKNINWSENLFYAGESLHLENLFANLIKNAIEASPENSQVITSIYNKANYIETIIHNKGSIPEEIRDIFFDKYSTSRKKGGTGLGTYSAYLVTKAHKGEISFTTSEMEGTKLFVKLPKYNTQILQEKK
ncbi:MAG: GHKL domain-containing protein [Leptospiraceae bacterium]|nr:GHKL domain-containing protein [Leptospiraceae bacterium]